MIKKIAISLIILISFQAFSQTQLVSTKKKLFTSPMFVEIQKPEFDPAAETKSGEMYEFAKVLPTSINILDGNLTITPSGKVWTLGVKSEGAKAISLYYDQFWIPSGSKLYVYSTDQEQITGPFTAKNNHSSELFANELIKGDELIIEYFQPSHQTSVPKLHIDKIAYAYRAVEGWGGPFGSSDDCQVNVNCSEGDDWQNQINASCRIQIISGWSAGWCSGAMINNTSNNCTPYVLSADHCFSGGNISNNDLNQCIFYFNYQSNNCSNPVNEPSYDAITGCSLISNSGGEGDNGDSDFFLVELNDDPDFNPYFAGWNRSNTGAPSGVSVHHPSGDIKKISTYTSTLTSAGGLGWGNNNDTHWRVYWSETQNGHGVTEGGSSGSPIFNQNGLIVGKLTGGSSYCNATNQPDVYGKIWYSWDQMGNSSTQRLKPWLDPNNTNAITLEGMYCGGTPGCTDPLAENYNPEATIDDGSCIYPCSQVEVVLNFLPDCYGVETSWELRNEQNQLIYSIQEGYYPGGDNADEMEPNPSWSEHVWCLEDGCYTFTVFDSYGDGMNGANPEYQCGQDGDYNIQANGNQLANLIANNANFGDSESNEFCVDQSMGTSFNCVNESCIDPGNGSGQYNSLQACINACQSSANPSWNCLNGDCIDPGDGSGMYNALSSCQNSCHTSSISEFQQSDRISRITNLLGQEVEPTLNTPLIIIFEDGSIIKRVFFQ
tara:strand:+ start:1261 stop:3414 length:2154 start_codon:yes stop_codon:yes gene_type:complete